MPPRNNWPICVRSFDLILIGIGRRAIPQYAIKHLTMQMFYRTSSDGRRPSPAPPAFPPMEYHVQMGFRAILCCLAAVGAGAAQGPPINIAGADNTGLTVALAVDSPSFSRFLLVQAVDNRGAQGVTVKINPLVGPGQRRGQPRPARGGEKKESASGARCAGRGR